ncbi:hypothetical protein IWT25_00464 [Secundilactobacillus pentosiphilus]|uniref:Gram-positive cocci surface proteins LPxTG domain-containing protein n=1 Tax=Secundilactobacillus pentosiphilus TaxID=1714682 RepID=A0A1Z5IUL9_9LACO|nr:KxYKxGKxW signal peptide domain-containing protein [Secundilactobacillus pentosiphilus]GAX05161.1 hypothetical protein IWT25_00464 [Secundilactobacillus pentosiphilus]
MLHGAEKVMRYKMYKAKKHWLFAGVGFVMMSGALLVGGGTVVHAATTAATAEAQAGTTTGSAANGDADTPASNTQGQADAQPQSLTDYNAYKDGGYATATHDYETAKTGVDAAKQTYQDNKDTYQNKLNDYQTDVNTQAPNYQTTDRATQDSLNGEYQQVKTDYDHLNTLKDNTNSKIDEANAAAKQAQDQLDALYNALPDNIKNAGATIEQYNQTTKGKAQQLVTGSTADAYAAAVKAQASGIVNTVNSVSSKATAFKVLIPSATDATGKVTADLYGETYTDRNGDNQITYEDDVLPVVLADLKADTDKVAQNETDLTGSYAEVVALFSYMKQVADTALPYQSEDGSVGRINSAQANDTSYQLMHNGSPLASGFGSTYATQLLNSIESMRSQMETTVENIYTSTGNSFDEAGFTASFDQNLKDQAILIYQAQTNELLKLANNLLAAFQAADASGDELWATSPSAGVKTNTLTATLQTAINKAEQQVTDGMAALKNLPASDHFLTIAYSTGDAASGFTQTINQIWKDLYHTMDTFGMSMSPLMKFDMASADKNATKDSAGNTVYSPEFIKDHAVVFNAATTLANDITALMQQSSVITNDYETVLNSLLTINGNYDLVKPQVTYMQTIEDTVTTPQAVTLGQVNVLVHLNYVDDDNGAAPVKNDLQTLRGQDGDELTWTAQIPAGYELAKDQAVSGTVTAGNSNSEQTVTIHLIHEWVTTSVDQTYTTNYALLTSTGQQVKLPGQNTQTITWTVKTDQVNGDWTATPDQSSTQALATPAMIHNTAGTLSFIPDLLTFNGGPISLQPISGKGQAELDSKLAAQVQTVAYREAKLAPGIQVGTREQVPDTAPSTMPAVPNPGPSDVVTPAGEEATNVPEGGNDTQPADDTSTSTDVGGDTSTTGTDRQTRATGQAVSASQAGGQSQTISGGTATKSQAAGVQTGTKPQAGTAAQSQLPQTNETDEKASAALGVLGLSLLMSALGLKKRKRD